MWTILLSNEENFPNSLAQLFLNISYELPYPHCTGWGLSFLVAYPLVYEHFHMWKGVWLVNLGLRKKRYMYNQFCSILLRANQSQSVRQKIKCVFFNIKSMLILCNVAFLTENLISQISIFFISLIKAAIFIQTNYYYLCKEPSVGTIPRESLSLVVVCE